MKKMLDFFKQIKTMFEILIDESRTINEDGLWDKYNRKINKKQK